MSDGEDVKERGIDRLPSGKFRVRVGVGKKRRTVAIVSTLAEAIERRDAAYYVIATGSMVASEGMTVAQRGPSWLVQCRAQFRSYASDRSRFNKHIVGSSLGDRPIQSITPRDVRAWLLELKAKRTEHKWGKRPAKPLSHQLRKHCLSLLRAFFAQAIEDELISMNPAVDVEIKDAARVIPDDWYLTPAEQVALLSAIDGPERWIVAFAIGTGLRQGEQWNLLLEDLHVDGDDPHVFVRFGSAGHLPKNGKTRKVPLFGLALDAARAWLDELPAYAPHNPLGLAFPTPAIALEEGLTGGRRWQGGARRGKSKVPTSWADATKAVTRLKPWWHLLRHTAASSLVAGWWGRKWSLEEVCKLLGHSSIRVTERYAHMADSALRDVAAATHAGWSRGGHDRHPQNAKSSQILGYARQESNLRHSASKAQPAEVITSTYERRDPLVTTALDLLEKTAAGSTDWRPLAEDLSAGILARRDVRLALQIASGGEWTLTRAVELAELVVANMAPEQPVKKLGPGRS